MTARILLTSVALLLCMPVLATTNDREQPIHVTADTLEIDDQAGQSIYQGNVLMVQGTIRIESDKLVVIQDEQQQLDHFRMWGNPVRFKQLNNRNEPLTGRSLYMEYHDKDSLLILKKEAFLDSNGDTVESDYIQANTETDYVKAGDTKQKSRVKMLILPRNKE